MTDEINRDSLDYTLGRIEQRLASGDKALEKLSTCIDRLDDTIKCLPCSSHEERLKDLEGNKTRRYSFGDAVKISVISSVSGGLMTAGIFLLFGG